MGQRGGRRPGAGRKKGTRAKKKTNPVKERLAQIIASGEELPLDFLLRVMRAPEPTLRNGESSLVYLARYREWSQNRQAAANAAAPYCHHRLSTVEHTGPKGGPMQHRTELVFVEPDTK